MERLFGVLHAFDDPVTVWLCLAVACVLVASPVVIGLLARQGRVDAEQHGELSARCRTWLLLASVIVLPALAGAAFWFAACLLLSLGCLREFGRATGLFREQKVCAIVLFGICLVYFAVLDHWYGLFVALVPLGVGLICVAGLIGDRPDGYIQRVALGTFAFLLFGCALGHLAYLANDANYRPIVLALVFAVAMTDVFAYVCGKAFGKRKLAPNTSPNKTVGGALGATLCTTPLFALLCHFVFEGSTLDSPLRLLLLGLLVSVCAQLGDLMLSSIKRDLGIKDLGQTLPGHGGLLDRFDSMLLVAPAFFHYVNYYVGVGLGEPARILSGGG